MWIYLTQWSQGWPACLMSSGLSHTTVPACLPPTLLTATDSGEEKSKITVAENSWGEFPALFPWRHPQRLTAGCSWASEAPSRGYLSAAVCRALTPQDSCSVSIGTGWGGGTGAHGGFQDLPRQTHRVNRFLHKPVLWVGPHQRLFENPDIQWPPDPLHQGLQASHLGIMYQVSLKKSQFCMKDVEV